MLTPNLKLTPQEFCYWLQGAIEIGGMRTLTDENTRNILHKLDKLQSQTSFTFACSITLSSCGDDPRAFNVIYEELQKMFLHEIDPTYEGDQEFLLAVHRGEVDHEGKSQA
jgi:hypothetical protein